MAKKRNSRNSRRAAKTRFADRPWARAFEALIGLAVLCGFGYGFLGFTKSAAQFEVRAVQIEGTRAVSNDEVMAASGITGHDNVLFFDHARTKAGVESIAYVKSCSIGRTFPDTVLLKVQERTPEFTLMINSQAYEVDGEGIVLRRYGLREMPIAPFITNVGGVEFVEIGKELTEPAFVAATEVVRAFAKTRLSKRVKVSELAAYDEDDIRMYCNEIPFEIRWGRGGFDAQAERLDILWRELNGKPECHEYLDLRFGERLVCK